MLENETDNEKQVDDQTEVRITNRVPVEPQINNPRPARAYVPFQYMTEVFEPEQGLQKGTIFPQLNIPWEPGTEMHIMPAIPMPMSPESNERS